MRALRTSLELCRACGVPAALVLMPEGTDFRAWYPPAVAAALADLLTGLAAEFGVSLIDARPWLSDEAFSDGHHMLPDGAAALNPAFDVTPSRYVTGFITDRGIMQPPFGN